MQVDRVVNKKLCDRRRAMSFKIVSAATRTSCTTSPQQIDLMELEHYDCQTCKKLRAPSHDATIVVSAVNKLDRRRVLLTM